MDQVPPPPEPAPPSSRAPQLTNTERSSSESPALHAGANPTTSVMPIVPPMMSSPVVGTMPPPPVNSVSAMPNIPSPIMPPSVSMLASNTTSTSIVNSSVDRSSASPTGCEPTAPPPSSATSVNSDYIPPSITSDAAPFFGTGAIPKNTTPAGNVPMFTMPSPDTFQFKPDPAVLAGMPVPDPAVLAGLPVPPILPEFNNLSVNGMPTPPVTVSSNNDSNS